MAVHAANGTVCRFCGSGQVSTTDSRPTERPGWRRRRRRCLSCDQRWTSVELPIEDVQTILHITNNLDTLSGLALKLHHEIEAMKRITDDVVGAPTGEADAEPTANDKVRVIELTDL